jgi:hypothetical protein
LEREKKRESDCAIVCEVTMFAVSATEDKGAYSPSFIRQQQNRYGHGDGTSVAALMTEEELEAIMENFANEDTDYNKTWTRIVVEKMLSKVRNWMYPIRCDAIVILQFIRYITTTGSYLVLSFLCCNSGPSTFRVKTCHMPLR